jgi:trigger factor
MEQKEALLPAELSNDQLKVVVHKKPACRVEVEVEASTSFVKTAHEKAIKQVSKQVTISGFRKGKAPDHLVAKNYPEQVNKEWQQCIADEAFRETLKLTKLPILSGDPKISYNMKSYSFDNAKLILGFEVEPEIPTINPQDLELKGVERPVVNADKVEETIRQVLLFFAKWNQVTDRPIQEGDFLILDVDIIEEDPPKSLFKGVRFEVTDRSMAKWMKDLVLGKNAGDTVEGVSVPDADAKQSDKDELKAKKVKVTIHTVEAPTLPPLDDEFARRMGAPSLSEMKTMIDQLLTKKADDHVREKLREQLSDRLLEQYPFDLPMSLIERETRYRLEQLFKDNEFVSHWNTLAADARRNLVESISTQSSKAVRMFYLCRKVLSDAKLSISPTDLPRVAETPLSYLLGEHREINPQANTEVQQAEAYSRLLLEKAEDHLISHAKIV